MSERIMESGNGLKQKKEDVLSFDTVYVSHTCSWKAVESMQLFSNNAGSAVIIVTVHLLNALRTTDNCADPLELFER